MTTSPGGQPDKIVHENLRLVDASAKDRFELYQDHPDSDETSFIGFICYRMAEDAPHVYVLPCTTVAAEYGRRGYARAMATLVLEQLKNQEQTFSHQCSYIEGYLRRYPEYLDLLADSSTNP